MPETNTIAAYATLASACFSCVSVILTIFLVMITVYYARQTGLTVIEMKEGRRLSGLPLITFEVKIIPENGPEFPGRSNKVVIQNIGNAPALKTTVALNLINSETSRVLIKPVEWSLGILGINQQLIEVVEKASYDVYVSKTLDNSPSERPRIEITSSCQNSYGVISETIAKFELQVRTEQEFKSDAEAAERVIWKKLEEVVRTK